MTIDKYEKKLFDSGDRERRSSKGKPSIKGFILLPDTWSLPAGLSFTDRAGNWTTNTYSGADWTAMENAGAVFLPCAGKRSGATASDAGEDGYYWTSTSSNASSSYRMRLSDSGISADLRHLGYSVRLVIDAD